jgi:hypothetical protein
MATSWATTRHSRMLSDVLRITWGCLPELIDVEAIFADPEFAVQSISPDGRIAYVAPKYGRRNVWVRGIDEGTRTRCASRGARHARRAAANTELDVAFAGGLALRPGPNPPGSSRCKTYGA